MDDNNDYIINTDDIVIEKSIIQEKVSFKIHNFKDGIDI